MVLTLSDDQVAALGELHVAAWKGSRQDVVKLVNEGCPVDGTAYKNSPFYCTPLHLAVMSSRHAVAKSDFLLSNGARINAQDANGDTPLHRAVSSGDAALSVVKCLLEWRIKTGIENKDFDTPYDLAVKGGQTQIIELFCKTNPWRLLLAAAKYRRIDLVQRCLEQREEQKAKAKRRSKTTRLVTREENDDLAAVAVMGGDEEILKYLVEKGLKLKKVKGVTILIAAVVHGDPAVLRFLLNLGWKFPKKVEKKHKKLVMKRAVRFAGVEMLEYLTAKGFSINVGDEELADELRELAIRRRDSRVVDWLVEHGIPMYGAQALEAVEQREDVLNLFVTNGVSVDSGVAKGPRRSLLNAALAAGRVDLADHLEREGLIAGLMEGREHSLLRDAAMTNNLNFFKDLVQRGLRLHATNAKGETLLHTAVKSGNQEIIAYFLDEGADISATDKKEQTVLHVVAAATSREAKATIKYLLDNGADVLIDEKDEDGWSVLHYAAWRWDDALADLLLAKGAITYTRTKEKETPLSLALEKMNNKVCSEELVKTLFLLLSHGASWNKDHADYFDRQMSMYGGKRDSDEESDEDDEDEDDSSEDSEQDGSQPEDEEECDQGVNNDIADEEDDEENEGDEGSDRSDESDGSSSKEDDYESVESDDDDTSVRSCDSLYSRQSMTSDDYCTLAELQNDQPVEDDWYYNSELDEEDDGQSAEQDPLVIRALIVCVKAWLRERALGDSLTPIPWNVIEGGPCAVEEHYVKLGKSIPERVKYHHRVCVLGSKGSGKTTLIESLKTMEPRLEHQDKRPVGIRIVPIGTRDDHRITFWDIAGLDIFEPAIPRFFTEETLYLICVDLKAYHKKMKEPAKMKRFVSEHIFKWTRLIVTQHPKANFLIVGTKGDRVTSKKKLLIQRDFKAHLADKLREELYDSRDGQLQSEGQTTHTGAVLSYAWVNVSCNDEYDVKDAGNQILEAIKNSDGVAFGPKHASVLDTIKRRVKDMGSSADRTESVNILCTELVKTIDDMTLKQCRRCLDDLQAAGKVWYLQDTRSTTVFLDPVIIPQGLCALIQRVKSSDVYSESEIDEVSFWGVLSSHDRLQLKRALQHLGLAYPATTAKIPAMIIPACWKHRENTQKAPLIQQHSLFTRHDVDGNAVVCWEYELSVEASARVFVQFTCTCEGLGKRAITHRNYFQDVAIGDVVVVASLNHHDINAIDVVRIEIAAKETEVGWRRMVLYVMAMDKTLREFPGLPATQFIVDNSGGRHELEQVTTRLAVETKSGMRIDRHVESWMPPEWWLSDWKDEEKAVQWLRQHDMHKSVLAGQTVLSHKMDAVRKLVIADPTLRQFPALWTLAYSEDKLVIHMRSDYSGECHQEKPIVVPVPRGYEFLAKHGDKIQVGVSILSNVVPTFISKEFLQKITETAFGTLQSGVGDGISNAKTLRSMIQGLDLSPGSQFTSADKTLTPGETTMFLRDLLRLHDPDFDPLMISKLSGLESAVTGDGRFVWASRQEIEESKGYLEPCYTARVGKTPVKLELVIESVTGLGDTMGTFCEWQLLDASSTPPTCVLKDVTSQPTDTTDPGPSDPFRLYYIQSEDELSTYHLRLQIKKNSSPWRQRILQCSTRLAAWSTSVLGEGVAEYLAMGEFVIAIKNPKTSSIAEVKCRISSSA